MQVEGLGLVLPDLIWVASIRPILLGMLGFELKAGRWWVGTRATPDNNRFRSMRLLRRHGGHGPPCRVFCDRLEAMCGQREAI